MTLAQNTISEIIDICKTAKEEYEKLAQELSNSDREIQDILHRIEFEEFNSSNGLSVALKLKYLRVMRRKIKNELSQLQTILAMIDSQKLYKIQQRIINQAMKQESRHYKPRVISDRLVKSVNC